MDVRESAFGSTYPSQDFITDTGLDQWLNNDGAQWLAM